MYTYVNRCIHSICIYTSVYTIVDASRHECLQVSMSLAPLSLPSLLEHWNTPVFRRPLLYCVVVQAEDFKCINLKLSRFKTVRDAKTYIMAQSSAQFHHNTQYDPTYISNTTDNERNTIPVHACVAVCCSVLQCVAVRCSVLQCCSVSKYIVMCDCKILSILLPISALWWLYVRVLQRVCVCVAVWYRVLQCVIGKPYWYHYQWAQFDICVLPLFIVCMCASVCVCARVFVCMCAYVYGCTLHTHAL